MASNLSYTRSNSRRRNYSNSLSEESLENEIAVLQSIYLDELSVTRNAAGHPTSVRITLHPATADDADARYVTLTLNIKLTERYPVDLPKVSLENPRGLSDEHFDNLGQSLLQLAEERCGGAMLYEIIEFAKDSLTHNNRPNTECSICLVDIEEEDVFTKTKCYHYFHSYCLGRHITHIFSKEEEEILCPVCREDLGGSLDVEGLLAAPEPAAKEGQLTLEPQISLDKHRREMADIYHKQKIQGGIIDVDREKNKFLINTSQPPPSVSPSDSTPVDGSEVKSADDRERGQGGRRRPATNGGRWSRHRQQGPGPATGGADTTREEERSGVRGAADGGSGRGSHSGQRSTNSRKERFYDPKRDRGGHLKRGKMDREDSSLGKAMLSVEEKNESSAKSNGATKEPGQSATGLGEHSGRVGGAGSAKLTEDVLNEGAGRNDHQDGDEANAARQKPVSGSGNMEARSQARQQRPRPGSGSSNTEAKSQVRQQRPQSGSSQSAAARPQRSQVRGSEGKQWPAPRQRPGEGGRQEDRIGGNSRQEDREGGRQSAPRHRGADRRGDGRPSGRRSQGGWQGERANSSRPGGGRKTGAGGGAGREADGSKVGGGQHDTSDSKDGGRPNTNTGEQHSVTQSGGGGAPNRHKQPMNSNTSTREDKHFNRMRPPDTRTGTNAAEKVQENGRAPGKEVDRTSGVEVVLDQDRGRPSGRPPPPGLQRAPPKVKGQRPAPPGFGVAGNGSDRRVGGDTSRKRDKFDVTYREFDASALTLENLALSLAEPKPAVVTKPSVPPPGLPDKRLPFQLSSSGYDSKSS